VNEVHTIVTAGFSILRNGACCWPISFETDPLLLILGKNSNVQF
jgi:hypothetical protein